MEAKRAGCCVEVSSCGTEVADAGVIIGDVAAARTGVEVAEIAEAGVAAAALMVVAGAARVSPAAC